MSDAPRILYVSRPGASSKGEAKALVAAYAFLREATGEDRESTEPDNCGGAAKVRDKKEVGYVEQRPNRGLEIDITNSRK